MLNSIQSLIKITHLTDAKESYFQHMKNSLYISYLLLIGSMAAAIHAVLPWIFYKTASNINFKVAALRLKRNINGTRSKLQE